MEVTAAPAFVSANSGVITRLTSRSPDSAAYNAWIGDRTIAVSFQVKAELLSCRYSETRMNSLNLLIASCVDLKHSEATNVWYARVADTRRELQKTHHDGGNAGQADVWVISSTLEHGLVLLAHDGALVQLACAMNLQVFTNLPDLRAGNPEDLL